MLRSTEIRLGIGLIIAGFWSCFLAIGFLWAEEPVRSSIFDGASLNGWRSYQAIEPPKGWKVVDGCLYRAEGGGDIMTVEKYDEFDLSLEWKISPGGNSGIIYHVREGDDAAYFSGPEFQVLDDAAFDEDKRHLSGALYGLYACEADVAKPAGDWNTARIVLHGNRVQHWLNGTKVVDCTLHSEDWNRRVAASKFSAWKQFGNTANGHIVLQDHGNPVWYRNIKIAKLTGQDHGDHKNGQKHHGEHQHGEHQHGEQDHTEGATAPDASGGQMHPSQMN